MTAIRILSSLVFMSGVLVTDAHAGRGENYVKGYILFADTRYVESLLFFENSTG